MKAIVDKHITACVAELRTAVAREFAQAIAALTPADKRAKRSPSRRKPAAAPIPPTPAPRAAKPDRAASAKPATSTATSSRRTCGCGPVGRHRRECKLATGTGPRAAKKPASDDEDRGAGVPADRDLGDRDADDGRLQRVVALGSASAHAADPAALTGRPRTRRPSTAVTPAPELPVIPHAALVAMLAADRDVAGSAGGLKLRASIEPSLVGHTDEKREHCPVHGWVGRLAFERDGHEHCAVERSDDAEPCSTCKGTGLNSAGFCKRCGGTGYRPEELDDPDVDNSEKITAEKPHYAVVDGERLQLTRDHRGHDRAESTSIKALTRAELAAGWDEIRAMDASEPGFVEPTRPRTRGECGEQRPCPYVSCRHHLALEVSEAGSIKLVLPDVEPWELMHSCSLDAADLGPHTLDALSEKLNVTRERVRQLEVKALYAMRAAAMSARVVPRSEIDNVPHDAAEGATTP